MTQTIASLLFVDPQRSKLVEEFMKPYLRQVRPPQAHRARLRDLFKQVEIIEKLFGDDREK